METLIKILITIAIITFFLFIAKVGIARQEKVTCNKLAHQAETYPNFYYTIEESQMCGLGRD